MSFAPVCLPSVIMQLSCKKAGKSSDQHTHRVLEIHPLQKYWESKARFAIQKTFGYMPCCDLLIALNV